MTCQGSTVAPGTYDDVFRQMDPETLASSREFLAKIYKRTGELLGEVGTEDVGSERGRHGQKVYIDLHQPSVSTPSAIWSLTPQTSVKES